MNAAPFEHPLPFAPGDLVEGRYAVTAVHARRADRALLRARDTHTDAPCALKVQREEAVDAALRRIETLARLDAPALARPTAWGVTGAWVWSVRAWVAGEALTAVLAQRAGAAHSPGASLSLLRGVMQGLAAAHRAGLAHRDLTPDNLVHTGDPDDPLRLVDFDTARLGEAGDGAAEGGTSTHRPHAVTPRYAAPEQLAQGRTGPWTDVHALALLLTELLTGRTAYRALDGPGLLPEVFAEVRPTPGRVGVAVGPWEAELARALHRRVTARHADAGALLDALTRTVDAADAAFAASAHAQETPWSPARPAPTVRSRRGPPWWAWLLVGGAVALGWALSQSRPAPSPAAPGRSAPSPRAAR
ncbi:MAG: protein kinase [Polyangiales bacterium]